MAATLDQIRASGEAEFRDKLEGLDRRHRDTILAALEEYGHPRNIPEEVWAEIEREQEDELVAAYLLLMLAGDEWTADEIERQGVTGVAARSDASYALQAARRAQAVAAATTDTVRDRITRSVTDVLASPTGGVGRASAGDLRQAVDDVFTAARRDQIAATETTGSMTAGQQGAAERARGSDGASLADGQRVEIEMRWRTRPELSKTGYSCPQCAALEGLPEEVWGLVYPDGPGDEAHTHCNCYLEPVVVVSQAFGESFTESEEDDSEGHWVTINGSAVKIDGDGVVVSGPGHLKGMRFDRKEFGGGRKNAEDDHMEGPKDSRFLVTKANYAKNKMAVSTPSDSDFRTRASRLADGLGGKYSNRERAYIMSPARVEKFRKLLGDGIDWSPITGKFTDGEGNAIDVGVRPRHTYESLRESEDGDEKWVTINGNHVKISGDGEVLTGPMKGTKIVGDSKPDSRTIPANGLKPIKSPKYNRGSGSDAITAAIRLSAFHGKPVYLWSSQSGFQISTAKPVTAGLKVDVFDAKFDGTNYSVTRTKVESFREAEEDDSEGRWVTINGNHVKISGDGEVLTGPLKGEKLGGDSGVSKPNSKSVNPKVAKWAAKQFKNKEHARAFAKWFGNSKVVADDGSPLKVFHGTGKDFSIFTRQADESGPDYAGREVHWFSSNEQYAVSIANESDEYGKGTPQVVSAYLKADNPFDYRNESHVAKVADEIRKTAPTWAVDDIKGGGYFAYDEPGVLPAIKRAGFNAITSHEGGLSFAVFSSSQIKSATGNRGKFDPANPDIRESA